MRRLTLLEAFRGIRVRLGIELGQKCKRVCVCHLLVEPFDAHAMLGMGVPGVGCQLCSAKEKDGKQARTL